MKIRSLATCLAVAILCWGAGITFSIAQSPNAASSADAASVLNTSPVQATVATTAAPAVALTKPTLVDASKISAGDTAWMLTSTALVLLMTIPGLALFYAGMVRKKNALGAMAHSFGLCRVSNTRTNF